jgi:hypothetical protein
MHVVSVQLRSNASCFDQDTYEAPAGEAFTFEVTNSAFTLWGEPLRGTVLVSRSSDPARVPIPDRPWMGVCEPSRAIFISPEVTAPRTVTATVHALTSGDYVLQLQEGWGHRGNAALTVRPSAGAG